ncbi:hypothetical protein M2M59_06340 [Rummeliibacillus sp. G93]|uniref:hypothetical protein n=1 Tax=Rummeliibacillus TaxID=648802 RepID=UPI00116C54CD|nr:MULTISPECIES: hypothetical protein [Rummeliibacillus]MBB5169623.1 hypothetical protein [Rummeliibacillus stabekisii]UQW98626.1 hypothetical protein M2M59_06340 [Rummeliibacillus sp. G93]GEL03880.1 hypothetical protein RST01_05070 [Rummeliibacillus stabekisii]
MEALIFLIITSLVGYLFKNKDDDASKTTPPINRKIKRVDPSTPNRTRQKAEEYTRKAIGELEGKMPRSMQKRAAETVEKALPKAQELIERQSVGRTQNPIFEKHKHTTTVPTEIKKTVDKKSTGFKFPQSTNEMANAIIMAEILGPPKSKR